MGVRIPFQPRQSSTVRSSDGRGVLLSYRRPPDPLMARRSRLRLMARGALAWIGVWLMLLLAAGIAMLGTAPEERDRAGEPIRERASARSGGS